MAYYTFVLEYISGRYLSQFAARSPEIAFVEGAKNIDISTLTGISGKPGKYLIEQMTVDSLVPIKGLSNVWSNSTSLHGRLALVTLIQTERQAAPENK